MRFSGLPAIILTGIALGAFVGLQLGGWSFATNWSESMPRGLYIVGPVRHARRGDLVAACIPTSPLAQIYAARRYIPSSGECPSGLSRILKPVAGGAGDLVEIGGAGVSVNSSFIPGSDLLQADTAGRPLYPLPPGRSFVLGRDTYFLLSTWSPRSLDSRYFGPVTSSDLVGRVWPVLTW